MGHQLTPLYCTHWIVENNILEILVGEKSQRIWDFLFPYKSGSFKILKTKKGKKK